MDAQSLEARIVMLESRLRRTRRAMVGGGALFASLLLMGQAAPRARTVEAQAFVLKDSKGRQRAFLGLDGAAVVLRLEDAKGVPEAVLSEDASGPALRLERHEPAGTLALAVGDRGPSVSLLDAEAAVRATLQLEEGDPSLVLRDGDENRAVLGVAELDTTRSGGVHTTTPASLILYDKGGQPLWSAP
jgi:hypothetical protein